MDQYHRWDMTKKVGVDGVQVECSHSLRDDLYFARLQYRCREITILVGSFWKTRASERQLLMELRKEALRFKNPLRRYRVHSKLEGRRV